MNFRWRYLVGSLVVCLIAVVAIHWQFLGRGFELDDLRFIYVRGASERYGYTTSVFPAFSLHEALSAFSLHQQWPWFWRPAIRIYFPLMEAIFGKNPVPFHAINLVVHAVVIWLASWLSFRLTRSAEAGIATGALFLLWPQNEEAVWWISSVSTLFCVAWCFVGAHTWLSFRRDGNRYCYLAFLTAFCAAAIWKSEVIFLPIIVLLLDLLYLRLPVRRWATVSAHLAPLVLLAVYTMVEHASVKSMTDVSSYYRQFEAQSFLSRLERARHFAGTFVLNYDPAVTCAILVVCIVAVSHWLRIEDRAKCDGAIVFAAAAAIFFLLFPIIGGSLVSDAERFRYFPFLMACIALGIAFDGPGPHWAAPLLVSSHAAAGLILGFQMAWGDTLSAYKNSVVIFSGTVFICMVVIYRTMTKVSAQQAAIAVAGSVCPVLTVPLLLMNAAIFARQLKRAPADVTNIQTKASGACLEQQ